MMLVSHILVGKYGSNTISDCRMTSCLVHNVHMLASISVLYQLASAAVPASQTPGSPASSGVYLTADDYASGSLSDAGSCDASSFKIAVHDVLNRPYIEVSRGSEKRQYAKNEIFGLRMCDGHDYRLSQNRLYRIVAKGNLYVYGVERPISQGKGFKVVVSYYFSPGPAGEVRTLTLEHLQEAFAANHRFIDSLERLSEQDLAQVDTYHQQSFKVARLLAESTDR